MASRVWTTIDFERDGFQRDYLRIPHSTPSSAYGWIPVPAICIRNGPGPTAVLCAGNHGDEYEGQVALLDLLRAIRLEDVRGRVIVLPALNYPAVAGCSRVSPIDGGDLNRTFPGRADGTPTEMLAHYLVERVFPLADAILDLHSGGRSLAYTPLAYAQHGPEPSYTARARNLLLSFGAPVAVLTDGESGGGATTLYAAAAARSIPALTTELGGGGTLDAAGLEIAALGIKRVLQSLGILQGRALDPRPVRMIRSPGQDGAVYASDAGLFQPLVRPGEEVRAGQVGGLLHRFDNPLSRPETILLPISGLISCVRFLTHTSRGDCLFNLLCDE